MIDWSRIRSQARWSLLLICLPVALGSAAWAQPDGGGGGAPPDGGQPGEMQAQRMQSTSVEKDLKQLNQLLSLSTEQQTQVKAILADRNQQIEVLFKQLMPAAPSGKTDSDATPSQNQPSRETMEDARTQMKIIRNEAQNHIVAVLTDSQKTKYVAWKKKHAKSEAQKEEDEMSGPPDGGGGGPDGGGGGPQGGGGAGGGPGGGGPPGI